MRVELRWIQEDAGEMLCAEGPLAPLIVVSLWIH
jgi:hypothetical protein